MCSSCSLYVYVKPASRSFRDQCDIPKVSTEMTSLQACSQSFLKGGSKIKGGAKFLLINYS